LPLPLRSRVYPVLPDLVEQGPVADLQQLRGPGAVSPSPAKCCTDVALLERAHGALEREVLLGRRLGRRVLTRGGPDALGEVLHLDQGSLREEHRPLDGVLQLADVPWPGVRGQELLGPRLESGDWNLAVELAVEAEQEGPGQLQDVLAASTERRDAE